MRVFTFLYYEYLNKETRKNLSSCGDCTSFLLNLYLILLTAKVEIFFSANKNSKNKVSG